jgi:Asparagine synthase
VRTKVAIRRLVEQRFGRGLARRPKQGFDPPLARWLAGGLRGLERDALGTLDGLIDRRRAEELLRSGTAEQRYSLLMLSLWHAGIRSRTGALVRH